MNFVIEGDRIPWSLCGSVVEHLSADSEFFSLSHARDKTKKTSFSIFKRIFFQFLDFKEEDRHCTNFINKLLMKIHLNYI